MVQNKKFSSEKLSWTGPKHSGLVQNKQDWSKIDLELQKDKAKLFNLYNVPKERNDFTTVKL